MEKEGEYSRLGILTVLPVVVYLLIIVFLGSLSETPVGTVLIGMSPSVICLAILIFYAPQEGENKIIVWLIPLVLSMIFLVIWASGISDAFSQMEGPSLAMINMIVGYFMTLFFIVPKWHFDFNIDLHRTRKIKHIHKYIEDKSQDDELENLGVAFDTKIDGKADMLAESAELKSMRNSLEIYEQRSKADALELQRLRHALYTYSSRPHDDSTQLYNIRESLAARRHRMDEEKDELKALRGIINGSEPAPRHENDTKPAFKSPEKERLFQKYAHVLKDRIKVYEQRLQEEESEAEKLKQTISRYAAALEINEHNFSTSLRTIEDKCKAINSVIGRVYSDKKGGSKETRDKLSIPREWYNMFSDILSRPKEGDEKHILRIVIDVQHRLKLYDQPEYFAIKLKKPKIPLARKKHDTVLDVMATNDSDPVREYVAEAKEICEKILHYLHKEQ